MKLIDSTDERLYTKCQEVKNPKSLHVQLLKNKMIKLMIKEKGIGLAAPQIGKNEALFVMYGKTGIITCINPSILWYSEEKIDMVEGCLSFPKMKIKLNRAEKIIAKYTNIKGEDLIETFEGLEARCFQHEYDHLLGITFIQRQNGKIY
jgi:peptide deformylase